MKVNKQQTFSFVYHVNLGGNKIGQIFINQESDPYIESSKFCAKYQLSSLVITILGDQLCQQIQNEKALQCQDHSQNIHQEVSGEDFSPKVEYTDQLTFQTQMKQQTLNEKQPYETRKYLKCHEETLTSASNFNVFDSLYNNHKEVQMKKQLERKRSFEAIPFKPQINQLSNQIVQQKKKMQAPRYQSLFRSSQQISGNSLSKTIKLSHRVYSKQKENDHRSQSRQPKKNLSKSRNVRNQSRGPKATMIKYNIEQRLMEGGTFRPKITARLL